MSKLGKLIAGSFGATLLASLALPPTALASTNAHPAPIPNTQATPYWTVGRNDAIVTADDTASKVWFALQRGSIGETFYPTVNVADSSQFQFVVVHNGQVMPETTSTTHSYSLLATNGLAVKVVNTAKNGSFALTHIYYTNPNNSSIVVRTWFTVLKGNPQHYQLYVFSHPQLDNQGINNSGWTATVGNQSMLVSQNNTVSAAIASKDGFLMTSTGYMGSNDGITQLEKTEKLIPYTSATGNIGQIGQLPLVPMENAHSPLPKPPIPGSSPALMPPVLAPSPVPSPPPGPSPFGPKWPSVIANHTSTTYTSQVVLSYGSSPTRAESSATTTLQTPWLPMLQQFQGQWARYLAPLYKPVGLPVKLQNEYWLALMTLKGAEDKTYRGAMAASLSTPWGEDESAVSPSVTGYHMVWVRDAYQMASAFMAAGDMKTAHQILNWFFNVDEEPNGNYPQNSFVNGTPFWTGQELDQNGFPVILAYQLRDTGRNVYLKHIRPELRYILNHGPWTDLDRWEEASGFSPNTMAVDIAALALGADIAQKDGYASDAAVYRGAATRWLDHIEQWTVTDNGPLSSKPYFVRISTGPNVNGSALLTLANGGGTYPQKDIVDMGFLSLVRLGLLSPDNTVVRNSLKVIDKTIEVQTPNGPGFFRYNHDGYGNYADGAPYNGSGVGGLWPVLAGERGEYELAARLDGVRTAHSPLYYLTTMDNMAYGLGMIPEQVWPFNTTIPVSPPGTNPAVASIGLRPGVATGSAAPLDWAMAQYVRLAVDISKHRLVDQPRALNREFAHTPNGRGPGMPLGPMEAAGPLASTQPPLGPKPPGQAALTLTVAFPSGSNTISVPKSGPYSVDSGNMVVSTTKPTLTGTTTPGAKVTVGVVNSSGLTSSTVRADSKGDYSIPIQVSNDLNMVYVVAHQAGQTTTKTYAVTYQPPALAEWSNLPFDDRGPGWYTYPTGGWYVPGMLSMNDVSVRTNASQDIINVSYDVMHNIYGAPNGFSTKLIEIYLVKPGSTATSSSPLPYTNIGFAQGSDWTYALQVTGYGSDLTNATGDVLSSNLGVSANQLTKTVTIRIPQSLVGKFSKGWGLVVTTLSQDGYAPGQVRPIAQTAGAYNFGYVYNDPNGYPTNVMDVLVPSGTPQEALDYLKGPIALHAVFIP